MIAQGALGLFLEPLEHAVPVEEVAAFQSQPAVIEEHVLHAHCALAKAALRCTQCRLLGLARLAAASSASSKSGRAIMLLLLS